MNTKIEKQDTPKNMSAMKRKLGWDFSFLDRAINKTGVNNAIKSLARRIENPRLRSNLVKFRPLVILLSGAAFGTSIFFGIPFAAAALAVLIGVYGLTADQIKAQDNAAPENAARKAGDIRTRPKDPPGHKEKRMNTKKFLIGAFAVAGGIGGNAAWLAHDHFEARNMLAEAGYKVTDAKTGILWGNRFGAPVTVSGTHFTAADAGGKGVEGVVHNPLFGKPFIKWRTPKPG